MHKIKKIRACMYKLITFKKIKHLKQISYNEFSKFHEAFMWAFNIFQEFCRCTYSLFAELRVIVRL
jgi:hypothetical protein